MDQEIKTLWIAALRSDDYLQGCSVLRSALTANSVSRYCCLGVLCELAVKANVIPAAEYNGSTCYTYGYPGRSGYLPHAVMDWAGLNEENPVCGDVTLANLNDNGHTFNQIADAIKENL